MSVVYLLIPLALGVAVGFLGLFFWAVRTGQYDDTQGPAQRILFDEPTAKQDPVPNPENG